ncbi:3-dehydroquinate synthase, partial [Streptomyces sp. NPDC052773]
MADVDGGPSASLHRGRPRDGRHGRPYPRRGRPSGPRRTGAEARMTTRIHVGGADPYDVLIGRRPLSELPRLVGTASRVAVIHPEALAETGEALRADLAGQGYEAVAI